MHSRRVTLTRPVGGGGVSSPFGGFFDLLTHASGWGLGLDFSTANLEYSGGAVTVTGVGTFESLKTRATPGFSRV